MKLINIKKQTRDNILCKLSKIQLAYGSCCIIYTRLCWRTWEEVWDKTGVQVWNKVRNKVRNKVWIKSGIK